MPLIMVGDASMAPSEILVACGAIAWNEFNKEPGQVWLKRLVRRFPYSVWLNPVPEAKWVSEPNYFTFSLVWEIFPMFELTPEGLEQAIKKPKGKKYLF